MIAAGFLYILIGLPLLCGGLCLACRSAQSVMVTIRAGIAGTAYVGRLLHLGSLPRRFNYGSVLMAPPDALSAYHLAVMMVVVTLVAFYLPGYFREEIRDDRFSVNSARRFGVLWSGAVAAMCSVLISNNIGLMWVGIEATTLVTAFLICIHRTRESIEAMWKYLIICSVGIAFAFMGTLLAGAAANEIHLPPSQSLLWTTLRDNASGLDPVLLKIAFVFIMVGYGTKAGLAPMHSWLPDAHSQAPAPVSALFSGFMLNAALYCIMRYVPLVEGSSGHAGWSLKLLLFFGLTSMLVAAAFIVFQRDLKRLLAYHSVEHLGIIAVGLGLGGLGTFAALLHTLNHSVCKSLAFFAAGRLGQMYGSHDMHEMAGALRAAPVWGKGYSAVCWCLSAWRPLPFSKRVADPAGGRQERLVLDGGFIPGRYRYGVRRRVQHAINIAWGEPATAPKRERAGGMDKIIVAVSSGPSLSWGFGSPARFHG